jgi:hypothetical protein
MIDTKDRIELQLHRVYEEMAGIDYADWDTNTTMGLQSLHDTIGYVIDTGYNTLSNSAKENLAADLNGWDWTFVIPFMMRWFFNGKNTEDSYCNLRKEIGHLAVLIDEDEAYEHPENPVVIRIANRTIDMSDVTIKVSC